MAESYKKLLMHEFRFFEGDAEHRHEKILLKPSA